MYGSDFRPLFTIGTFLSYLALNGFPTVVFELTISAEIMTSLLGAFLKLI
jgi:hypothetical protein